MMGLDGMDYQRLRSLMASTSISDEMLSTSALFLSELRRQHNLSGIESSSKPLKSTSDSRFLRCEIKALLNLSDIKIPLLRIIDIGEKYFSSMNGQKISWWRMMVLVPKLQ
jgi:hypothetical protein